MLVLIHGTYGRPRAARTTVLIEQKCRWPTLKKDTRAVVLSSNCRWRKHGLSKQLAMMPARLVQPWEVLKMDPQDVKVTSAKGNRRLLVEGDRASKLLASVPLPSRETLGIISRKLLEFHFRLPTLDPLPF